RADRREGALRGPARRHERRGGAPDPRRRQPAQRHGGEDDAGCRRKGGGAREMSILVSEGTKLVVSGLTGREGSFHGLNNKRYGTQVVAGVTPGKAGQEVEGIPVFNTVHAAVEEAGANTSM